MSKKKVTICMVLQLFFIFIIFAFCGAAHSCACCSTKVCDRGLYVRMSMEDDEIFPDGTYNIYAEVDGVSFQEQCVVEDFPQIGNCTENAMEVIGPMSSISVDDHPPSFLFHAEYLDATDDDGGSDSATGPAHVIVHVELNGIIIGQGEWWPEYVRDYEYWGHEDCGYCDLKVDEEMFLSFP